MNLYYIRHKDDTLLCNNNKVHFHYWSNIGDYEKEAYKAIKPFAILFLIWVLIQSDNECYLEKVKQR
jgi:hypothetical protein